MTAFLGSFCLFAKADVVRFIAEDLPPYHFLNEQGKADGVLVEIAKALKAHSGLEAKFDILPMARAHHELQTKSDVVMLAWLKTPSRAKNYQFLGVMCQTSASLMGLKSNIISLSSLEQAKQYRVSTIRGYYSEQYLKKAGFSEEHDLVLASHYKSMWHMLYRGRTDFVLTNTRTLQRELDELGLDPALLESKLTLHDFPSELHLAANLQFPKSQARKIQDSLKAIKLSGRYDEIVRKWRLLD
ncbi:substrate-binding periplasmic protein [Pseudoalteromonas umbrosa]|uniref:substrate-binding periplasmic protein n=1 Tax=Pseudoalteromonas umbrosa TaxID=3048489 RepID=UPI0024C23E83|nr:transporter substrate-binding domain-containing protein [Pseudoalteromonas sp. B95]MDK1285834.1 transporter substrate-binding domain-containing protein [Pseudoalteromonas sp. B95]